MHGTVYRHMDVYICAHNYVQATKLTVTTHSEFLLMSTICNGKNFMSLIFIQVRLYSAQYTNWLPQLKITE